MVLRPDILFIALVALKKHGAPYGKQWDLHTTSCKLSCFYSDLTAEHVETVFHLPPSLLHICAGQMDVSIILLL